MKNIQQSSTIETDKISDLIKLAWVQHSKSEQESAEATFRKALIIDPKSVEAYFGLALVLKSQERKKETIHLFEDLLELIKTEIANDPVRMAMLTRLVLGHINQLTIGDWNLEKEIWRR